MFTLPLSPCAESPGTQRRQRHGPKMPERLLLDLWPNLLSKRNWPDLVKKPVRVPTHWTGGKGCLVAANHKQAGLRSQTAGETQEP